MEKGSNLAGDDDERPSSDGRASTRTFKNRGIDPGKRERERERERAEGKSMSIFLSDISKYQFVSKHVASWFFFSEVITI